MDVKLNKRVKSLTRRAYGYLLWEHYAPVLALGVLFAVLFIILSMAGLWQRIGDPWRAVALIASLAICARSFLKARTVSLPNSSAARRRVEHDNDIAHRPLDTITDTPAFGKHTDPAWKNHIARAKSQLTHASLPQLHPSLKPIDKYNLRLVVPCLAILAAIVGFGDNYERLRASLIPAWQHGMSAKNTTYEAWIDPPQYTGRPPSYFKKSNTIQTPEGSEFVARISGIKTVPRLILREGNKTRRIKAKRLGPKSFEARAYITKDAIASYRIGNTTQSWTLNVDQDQAPSIKFVSPPEAGKRDKLIFTYDLKDDFGVENLSLAIALKSDPALKDTITINLPGSSIRTASEEPAGLDLTKHKWADKEVIGYLIATDGKGQTGESASEEFVIPRKIFVEPLAKAIAEQRLLMLEGMGEYAPATPLQSVSIDDLKYRPMFATESAERSLLRAPKTVQRTAELIDIITDKPAGIYEDPTVYMGLRNIYHRLQTAKRQNALIGIPQDLWAMALRAEFGLLGDALADMRAAERALNNAMARRAPQREVDVLFDRYNAAVDRYMEELMKKAIEDAKNQDGNDAGGGGGPDFQTDEIQELLDAIAEANRIGDTVAARKALAQLAQLLENMKIQLAQSSGQGEGPSDGEMSEELKEALEELNDILGEQRKLRDDTQSAGRADSDKNSGNIEEPSKDGKGQEGPKSAEQLAQEQEELSKLLEALEQGAKKEFGKAAEGKGADGEGGQGKDGKNPGNGDIKQALKDAKDAMGTSKDALKDGQYYRAGRAQSDAIDALREVGEDLLAQEAERIQQAKGEQSGSDDSADPFGRENDGNGVGDDVEVPGIGDQKKARELLEKLRKRAGEQEREQIERDYLDRLLERF